MSLPIPSTRLLNFEKLPDRMYENLTGCSFNRENASEIEDLVHQIFEEIVAFCDCTDRQGSTKKIHRLDSSLLALKKKAPENLLPVLIEGIASLRLSPEQLKIKIDDFKTSIEVGQFLSKKKRQISLSAGFTNRELIDALIEEIQDPYRDERGNFSHLEFLIDELDPSVCRSVLSQSIQTIQKSLDESGVWLICRQSRVMQFLVDRIQNFSAMRLAANIAPFRFRSS